MRLRRQSNGQLLTISDADLLGKGGEARVYRLSTDPALVAKIWHKPTAERAAKVAAMAANPPVNPTAAQKHSSIAWPVDILQSPDKASQTVGFLMPFVGGMNPVIDFFNPKTRRRKCPLFNYFYLHRTARNLVIAIRALHERNYVIGDLNESNVLAAETALVTLVDTDSFQVWDPAKGVLYRCRVGKPEFTPPELQGKIFGQVDRSIEHDLFAMGVLLFELLMEGTHPFSGRFTGAGDPPPLEARIAAGHFPHQPPGQAPFVPAPTAPSFQALYPTLQHLFARCFVDGHISPASRPDTQAWQWALEEAENSLVTCWAHDQHVYSGHLQACPWCERTQLLGGRDPFPSLESVKAGAHLGPAVAPPRTKGDAQPAPLHRSSHLPAPPIPRRIQPSVSPSTTKQSHRPFSGFPGPRNDWAWLSLFLGILSGILRLFDFPLTPLSAMLGLCLGVMGEVDAKGWYLDGKGQTMARIAMAINLLALVV